jgi:hypothetical protein
MVEKKVILLATNTSGNGFTMTFTKKACSEGSDLDSQNVSGFIKALMNFGSEVKSESKNFGSVTYGDAIMSYAVSGPLVLGIVVYGSDDTKKVDDAFNELVKKNMKTLIEVIGDPSKKLFMSTTLIPEIKRLFEKKNLI